MTIRKVDLEEVLPGPSPDDIRAHVENHVLNPLHGCGLCERDVLAQQFLTDLHAKRLAHVSKARHDEDQLRSAQQILSELGARPLLNRGVREGPAV